jgi:tetratricopeptide (TPR) repeat protein
LCAFQREAGQLAAQTVASLAALPNFESDPTALYYAKMRPPYSWQVLSGMALWASGVQNQNAYLSRIASAVNTLQNAPDLPAGVRQRGEYVLAFMHDNYLTRYVENQTLVSALLDAGAFNCVSSAVFYTILAVAVDLDVCAVITCDHAFATVKTDGGAQGGVNNATLIDVETTNRYGFDPGTRIEFRDEFGKLTGYAYADQQNYRDRVPISQLELVSLILANRISFLEKQNCYTAAIPLMADAAALLSMRAEKTSSPFFMDHEENLKICLINVGKDLERAGKYDDALQYIDRLQSRYPKDPELEELAGIVVHNAVATRLRQNRTTEARAYLTAHKQLVSQEQFATLNAQIRANELVGFVNSLKTQSDAEYALSLLGDHDVISFIGEKKSVEIRNAILNQEAVFISREQGLAAAIQFTEAVLATYGRIPTLEQNLEVFRNNYAGELHNNFASLWNSGRKNEAKAFLRDALRQFPNNRLLLNDLKIAESW